MSSDLPGQSDLHIQRLIDALSRPDAYPHSTGDIQVIQTHISVVFLTGEYVYKLKKPLDLGFLDFSTLRKRLHACQQEVTLNRRLCDATYLDVVPVREINGELRLDETRDRRGRVVDYAVKMRQLPHDRMLDHLIATGEATPEMLEAVAERLAAFHATSETNERIARFGSERVIRANWDENFAQTTPFIGDTISAHAFTYLKNWVDAWLVRLRRLIHERIAAGRVRDCHGDLRASAVCVEDDQLCIFDCIEFNRRFRYSDVASDVAFLVMDLESRGRPDLARAFVNRYASASGDEGLREIVDFYAVYRAYVRGKVDSFRSAEQEVAPDEREQSRQAARQRFAHAVEIANRRQPPLLLITCGLPGTGKSAIAAEIAKALSMPVIASDIVRKELAGIGPMERGDAAIYSRAMTERTYREMFERGRQHLEAGQAVILDATFPIRRWRAQAAQIARETGALFLCLETRADDDVVLARLERRSADPTAVSDAGIEVYRAAQRSIEPVDEFDNWTHIVVNTSGALDACVSESRRLLDTRLRPDT